MRWLVAWYGIYQAGHVVLNAVYVFGDSPPPFPGPPGGWNEQAISFLDAIATADLINAVAALVFVGAWFRGRPWAAAVGAATLTVSIYASIVFTAAAVTSGAWRAETAFGYVAIWVLFVPVLVLAVRLIPGLRLSRS